MLFRSVEAALAGGHICTMPFSIFQQMVKHPLTDSGLKKFLADWKHKTRNREWTVPVWFLARGTRGLGRPSFDARSGTSTGAVM